jgi:hypothetical protein
MSQEMPYDDAIARFKLAKKDPYWKLNMPMTKMKTSRYMNFEDEKMDKKKFTQSAMKFIIQDAKKAEIQKNAPPPRWLYSVHMKGEGSAGTGTI